VRIQTRRTFLAQMAGVCIAAGAAPVAQRGNRGRWLDRLGLQIYTVRDRLVKDFDATLNDIAAAGYKEVELFGSLGDRTAKDVRAALDRAGLAAVSTHLAIAPGPDLEKQLEAYQTIGHRFTAVGAGGGEGGRGGGAPPEPNTPERWKRQAEALNVVGGAGKKFGIRALVHNHVLEFAPLAGASTTGYEILLAQTDPTLVAMELDIGWASIAGQDVIAMFGEHPGRYPLWHVKDATGLKAAHATPFAERQRAAQFVPVGAGEIDYKAIFAAAAPAGLEHYFIEQDNAVDADSAAAIRTSAQNLKKLLG
jgi:sugar phosphate isomerase/epimerase